MAHEYSLYGSMLTKSEKIASDSFTFGDPVDVVVMERHEVTSYLLTAASGVTQ